MQTKLATIHGAKMNEVYRGLLVKQIINNGHELLFLRPTGDEVGLTLKGMHVCNTPLHYEDIEIDFEIETIRL